MQPGIPWNEDGPDSVYIDLSRDLVVKFKETTRHLFTVMQKINDSKTAKTKKQVSFFDSVKAHATPKADTEVWDDACEILK